MSNIKIMSLGGLGENGKNMTVVEVNNKIFILDAGMRYPDIDMYGVDLVIPNIDYLIDFAGAGALVPISNFGHSMTHSAIDSAIEEGYLGLLTGLFNLSSSGLSFAVFSAFIVSLVFKPRG